VGRLGDAQRAQWEEQGFFRVEHFADATVGEAMLERVVGLVRGAATGDDVGDALVLPEQQPDFADATDPADVAPEQLASKVFRVARFEPFREFIERDDLTGIAADLIGTDDLDCFLSQFIFKNPGAWGQPWHQDSYYFPFDPARPIVGLWLAVTRATLENGCLHVLPGSHHEPVHEHVPDRRESANYGYTEIVDQDTSASVPVLMAPGDLLVFDSHLMHRSTDNASRDIRAAMVFHVAARGTVDSTEALRGYTVNDWMPVRSAGAS
jgi:phytanoyl-CoA hydroxylase